MIRYKLCNQEILLFAEYFRRFSGLHIVHKLLYTLFVCFFLFNDGVDAQIPGVILTGVTVSQDPETRIVEIMYDLIGEYQGALRIYVQASADSGNTYIVPVKTVWGDIGEGIVTGMGKRIYWDAGNDYKEEYTEKFRIRIIVESYTENIQKMVFIPAGEFIMGGDTITGNYDEIPKDSVYIHPYFIDKYEVTNNEYSKFLTGFPHFYDLRMNIVREDTLYKALPGYEEYPVVYVSYDEAVAYTEWAGKRLSTEAEWEKAARGGIFLDGDEEKNSPNPLKERIYPWGNTISYNFANYYNPENPFSGTTPVGIFNGQVFNGLSTQDKPSPHGLYDMAGNVWEWVSDWYGSDYYEMRPHYNPQGPQSGTERVIRGGSWGTSEQFLRVSGRMRTYPANKGDQIGFRCVKEVGRNIYGGEFIENDNTLGLWHFNESSGELIADQMLSHNGSIVDTMRNDGGFKGNCLKFNGSEGIAFIPHSPGLRFTGSFTLELWVRKDSISYSHEETLLKKSEIDGQKYPIKIFFSPGDSGRVTFEASSLSDKITLRGKTDFLNRAWHHVAVVSDKENNKTLLYIDGKIENNTAGTIPDIDNESKLYIGSESDGSNRFSGYIDEMRILNYAHKQADILLCLQKRQSFALSRIFTIDTRDPAGLHNMFGKEKEFYLKQNYPNPFNSHTHIEYYLPVSSQVKIEVYNVNGQLVDVLLDNHENNGVKKILWNASRVSSGLYFIRIKAGNFNKTIKALYIK